MLGRNRLRWGDNIDPEVNEIGWERVDWIYLAQNKDEWRAGVTTVMSIGAP
jgi:hypothetical protein